MNQPTSEEIAGGVAVAKAQLAAAPIPDMFKDLATDAAITTAVTQILIGAANPAVDPQTIIAP